MMGSIRNNEEVQDLIGKKVWVYYNLHEKTFSGLYQNKLVFHADYVKLSDVEFRVRPGGKSRVRDEKRKNVHAFVIGILEDICEYPCENLPQPSSDIVITYNPYKNDSFIYKSTEEPVYHLKVVEMINLKDKVFAVNESIVFGLKNYILMNESERVLEPNVIKLFKYLDVEKKTNKTRAALLSKIENLAPYLGISPQYAKFLLELYVLNYRKDGNYQDLTKDNYVDPRKMEGKWTSNTKANEYTIAQLPFRGSNLKAYWTTDLKNQEYYVVESYGWYPVYIYKDGKWYENVKRYSSSTSRQMSNANPVDWSEDLKTDVFLLTPDEMKKLQRGVTHDEIMKSKLERLKSLEPELQKRRKQTARLYRSWYDDGNVPNVNVKFKINSIDMGENELTVVVDIFDVVKREGNTQIPTPENYLKGEIPNLTKEKVENRIKIKLFPELREYIGRRTKYDEEGPDMDRIKFKFNHLKK